LQRKQQKDFMDASAKADQIELETMRIETQAEIEGAKLGAQVARDKQKQDSDEQIEGIKLGLQMGQVMKESRQPSKKENK